MNKPLITIAIPTYNRANHFLRKTVQTALNQSYNSVEVLVSDNCSTDNTLQVIQEFRDPRLKYFRQDTNLGARGNMNFLLSVASGRYFHMYHDDDRIDPDFIESCVAALDGGNDVGLITTGSRIIDANDKVVLEKKNTAAGLALDDFILLWYRAQIHMFLCSTLFNTEHLRAAGGFEVKYNHFDDVAAEFKCAASGGRADVPDVKASFREHAASQTHAGNIGAWCDSSLALLDLACSLAPSRTRKIRSIGGRTSVTRIFRHAGRVPTRTGRIVAHFTVCRKFRFKYWPSRRHMKALLFGA